MSRPSYVQTHQPGAIVVKQQYTEQNAWHFENRWSSKLCACKPCGRCCFGCFCCCCMGCKLAKYMGESCINGCCPCSICYFRTKLRTARRIQGGCCDDCCSCCCWGCAATQTANELEQQGLWDPPRTKIQKTPRSHYNN